MNLPRLVSAPPLVGLLTVALSGCSAAQDRAASAAAAAFYAAVEAGNGSTACALLAPRARQELEQSSGKPCAQAILEEELPTGGAVRAAQVYGTMAQVAHGSDTVFLTRFDAGWRVVGSGCAPAGRDLPFDCSVQVG